MPIQITSTPAMSSTLNGFARQSVDFHPGDATTANPSTNMHEVMKNISPSHRLALTQAPMVANVSYCSLARSVCQPGMTPASYNWPAFPVSGDNCPYPCADSHSYAGMLSRQVQHPSSYTALAADKLGWTCGFTGTPETSCSSMGPFGYTSPSIEKGCAAYCNDAENASKLCSLRGISKDRCLKACAGCTFSNGTTGTASGTFDTSLGDPANKACGTC